MTDVEKLRALLPHWIEHNTEHANEFYVWIERIQAADQTHVADHLEAAAEKLEQVNRELQTALGHLDGVDHVAVNDLTHHHAHPHP